MSESPDPAYLDLGSVVLFVFVSFLTVVALLWVGRTILHDFPYPLDSDRRFTREGAIGLLTTYIVGAWVFSLGGAFFTISGATRATTTLTLILVGLVLVGALRIHSLARSFTSGRAIAQAPTLTEVGLATIACLLGAAVLVIGIGDFSTHLKEIAPIDSAGGYDPQPYGAIILLGSLWAASLVEAAWWFWSRTDAYERIARHTSATSVESLARAAEGALALRLYLRVGISAAAYDTRKLQRRALHLDPAISASKARGMGELLVSTGLMLPVATGGYRRHPHFHQYQQEYAEQAIQSLESTRELSVDSVEHLLSVFRNVRVNEAELPASLVALASTEGKPATEVVREVLEETLEDMRDAGLRGREWMLLTYLRERYWEGASVSEIARELNYSREHLTRIAQRQSLELFRPFLARRLADRLRASGRLVSPTRYEGLTGVPQLSGKPQTAEPK